MVVETNSDLSHFLRKAKTKQNVQLNAKFCFELIFFLRKFSFSQKLSQHYFKEEEKIFIANLYATD
jgi:hypothetical protein